jgi:hypothetical protein
MRAERVAQPMHPGRDTRALSDFGDHRLHDLLRQRPTVRLTNHQVAPQMTMSLQRLRESIGHGHVPQPSSFRGGHVSFPIRSLDAELPLPEIDVSPA